MSSDLPLSFFSVLSLVVLMGVYFFLITERINKVIVAGIGAAFLVLMQVFRSSVHSSQENAVQFIAHNLDILGFVVGMMILIGIVRDSGAFEALAIWLVKKVRGNHYLLLAVIGYLTLLMTMFFSNIPTILIMTPIVLILVKELKLPYLPYIFVMISLANLGGAMTPISDPTTYYQAKTVGLSFAEVLSNSGLIASLLSTITIAYTAFAFRKQLKPISIDPESVRLFEPAKAIRNRRLLYRGMPLLGLTILLMTMREPIAQLTGITFDNATIAMGAAFLAMLIFHREPKKVFRYLIDWEILFFFMGLFIIVGALEFTEIISWLGRTLVEVFGSNMTLLTLVMTVGSGVISTFIDNVPYNITMVGAVQEMAKSGMDVYPLWWALNLGTSIGGMGSPIAAACNVIGFGQAEKEGYHTSFGQYLLIAFPLVILNSLLTFGAIWLLYLR
ncbi:TRAP transporter large permease subunit [Candidatus Woesebacteria bacterium]|nr:TRAP transporter large permease subunit [Candidatus Woesebacteria bacterium]